MEVRKITVVQTKSQKKSVIMSAATTLAELKSDLRANDIDYDGMTFFEGTSKVELKNDASILPHDVPYKGTTTNELVFMLTNTNKKIRSGAMSRMEVYAEIKRMGLQDACLKKFGKNFTMCKTADLIELVQSNGASKPAPVAPACNGGECVDTVARTAISKLVEVLEDKVLGILGGAVARTAINKLVEILEDNGTIEDYEKEKVLDILGGTVEVAPSEEYKPKSASPYSDDEINDMFEGMSIH
jgi:hypothetical protein